MKLKLLTLTFFTICVATVSGTSAAKAASLTVLADGLDNPRNMGFDNNGNIYVTTSGRGGDGKDGRCIPSPSAQFIPLCAGENGSLIKITPNGQKQTVLSGLTSLALTPSGEQAAGPADFKFDSKGNAYFLTGFAGDPSNRDTVLKAPDLGKLYKVDLNTGSLTTLADFAEYERQFNPDRTDVITNPYAMTIKNDTAYVVDGGGNTIYSVGLDGSGIKNVAAFPTQVIPQNQLEFPSVPPIGEIPTGQPGQAPPSGGVTATQEFPISFQSVPTGITTAPDGSLTVSEYTYFPYPEGKARIFSVDPNNVSNIKEIATGFTQLTGVTYDSEGNLYALQHINTSEWKEIQQGGVITGDISGSIIKIGKDGKRETIWSGNGLEAASGLFFGPDGDLYTSNRARLAGTGQVVKIDLKSQKVPEPTLGVGLLATAVLGARATRKRKCKQYAEVH